MANTAWYGEERAQRKTLRVDWDKLTVVGINIGLWAAILVATKLIFF